MNGDGSDVINRYLVTENSRAFNITCRSYLHGRTIGMEGKEGILYIDSDDNKVHRQVVALGGGCGLLIDDAPVEGLSSLALRGVIDLEQNEETGELTINTEG
jgi:hypothetical protein